MNTQIVLSSVYCIVPWLFACLCVWEGALRVSRWSGDALSRSYWGAGSFDYARCSAGFLNVFSSFLAPLLLWLRPSL